MRCRLPKFCSVTICLDFNAMQEAFDWTLDQFIYFGGYPGAAALIQDEDRWRRYILDALIEPTLSKDILSRRTDTYKSTSLQFFTSSNCKPGE